MATSSTLLTPGEKLILDRSVIADLLSHAAAAAHFVGHIDDPHVGVLADRIDAIVHGLTELLGEPVALDAPGANPTDARAARDGALVLTPDADGAP